MTTCKPSVNVHKINKSVYTTLREQGKDEIRASDHERRYLTIVDFL